MCVFITDANTREHLRELESLCKSEPYISTFEYQKFREIIQYVYDRNGGPMVCAWDSGWRGPDIRALIKVLEETLNYHWASLHPGIL